MRGQYRIWISGITIGTSEATVCGIIVPANVIAELNRIELIGAASAATRVTWRLRRFTTGTPTLTGPIVAKAVDQGNAIAASVTFGTGWSAAPSGYDAESVAAGQFEAFGGRDVHVSSLQEALARIGGTSDSRYDLTAIASASAANCALRLTFTE